MQAPTSSCTYMFSILALAASTFALVSVLGATCWPSAASPSFLRTNPNLDAMYVLFEWLRARHRLRARFKKVLVLVPATYIIFYTFNSPQL